MGHSQGGTAAWGFAERLAVDPIPGYKGTVAFAPPTNCSEELDLALKDNSSVYAAEVIRAQARVNAAVTALFPAYNNSGMTPQAYDFWHNFFEKNEGCLPTDVVTFLNLPNDQFARPGWMENDFVRKYAKLAEVGNKPIKGPLLILHGEQDQTVSDDVTNQAAQDICNSPSRYGSAESLEMVGYSAMNHFSVIQASQGKWLTWVRDRLNGAPLGKKGCVLEPVEGVRNDVTVKTAAPNFLVEWESAKEFWKYVFRIDCSTLLLDSEPRSNIVSMSER